MTIQQLQDFINTKPDIRQLVNVIADYMQNNPGGGGGATPTLDAVIAAGATLTEDRVVDLNGHGLRFNDPVVGEDLLNMQPGQVSFIAADSTDSNFGFLNIIGTSDRGEFFLGASFTDGGGTKVSNIHAYAYTDHTLFNYNADAHNFIGVLNLAVQAAPASPNDGDIWREDNTNTGLKIQINGVTKTITVS